MFVCKKRINKSIINDIDINQNSNRDKFIIN